MEPETFKKLPLGGVNRRELMGLLAEQGASQATALLERQRPAIAPQGAEIAPDTAVLILGGSNGITRAIALQLVLGERAKVICVHYDSPRMQIGPHHIAALTGAAEEVGVQLWSFNADATKPQTVASVIGAIRPELRAVHLLNGIAAGTPKRHPQHGPTKVLDLDVAFDPVLQVPDFSHPESIRRLGWVEVGVASENETKRTMQFMGTSSLLWAEALADAGLLQAGESVVAFCDYDFPADDPVYGMGPLADAKQEQRRLLDQIRTRFGVRAVTVAYPAMATTALGAIPGALLAYGLSAQVLKERGEFRDLDELARLTMDLWRAPLPDRSLRVDEPFQGCLDEVRSRLSGIRPEDVPGAFSQLLVD
jgi:enoyl-[acyl-carrier protein] reductase/trans-2-enoyl-CoA reductase (NAD+)